MQCPKIGNIMFALYDYVNADLCKLFLKTLYRLVFLLAYLRRGPLDICSRSRGVCYVVLNYLSFYSRHGEFSF
jgi:hypothetical protein